LYPDRHSRDNNRFALPDNPIVRFSNSRNVLALNHFAIPNTNNRGQLISLCPGINRPFPGKAANNMALGKISGRQCKTNAPRI
jgi:hypothetical protein